MTQMEKHIVVWHVMNKHSGWRNRVFSTSDPAYYTHNDGVSEVGVSESVWMIPLWANFEGR